MECNTPHNIYSRIKEYTLTCYCPHLADWMNVFILFYFYSLPGTLLIFFIQKCRGGHPSFPRLPLRGVLHCSVRTLPTVFINRTSVLYIFTQFSGHRRLRLETVSSQIFAACHHGDSEPSTLA